MSKAKTVDLTSGPILKTLAELALPIMVSSMLGNYLGARFAIRGGGGKIRLVMFLVLGLLFVKLGLNLLGIIDF